jgi:hypothetical protein
MDLGVVIPDVVDWNPPALDGELYWVWGELAKGAGLLENFAPAQHPESVLCFVDEEDNVRG